MTPAELDRARGALLGTAAGDALGAPYEFKPAWTGSEPIEMTGGGGLGWAPGEWTDDTSMAVAIAEVAATSADLRDDAAQDLIVTRWAGWATSAPDVGIQTSSVLSAAGRDARPTAESARRAAAAHHESHGRSGGNGSLMRTAPVALAYIGDRAALADAATALSRLTHFDPDASDACVLWCDAIRHAIATSELDVRYGLDLIANDRREAWRDRIEQAEASQPADFVNNGWVVAALQGAWSAIARTAGSANHLRSAIEAAVRGGNDADTVAAIAGGLVGAAFGASALPAEWVRVLHGWPGIDAAELSMLADRIVRAH